jgi:hypothetical protein
MPTRAPLTLSVNQAICMIEPREAAMMIASTSSGEPLTSYRSPVTRAISVVSNGSGTGHAGLDTTADSGLTTIWPASSLSPTAQAA